MNEDQRGLARRLHRLVVWPATLLATFVILFSVAIREIAGAYRGVPQELESKLSPGAKALIQRAFADIDPARLVDYHTHVVGIGTGGTGAYAHPRMRSLRHPMEFLRFEAYKSALGIHDMRTADQDMVARLENLIRFSPVRGRHYLIAFDKHYRADGTVDTRKTELYMPNTRVFEIASARPEYFSPAVSIHPYRKDAVEAVEKWAARGVRMVKWLPNAMGMDPADKRIDAFYRAMKKHNMWLLTHAGDEKAVHSEEDQKLGNPLRLRRPLDLGLRVMVAHCAGLGEGEDLDNPGGKPVSNFELFLRLLSEKKYEGLLFGEISAMHQSNRLGKPLDTLLERTELHHRLRNGSDYPLPAVNFVVSTRAAERGGYITAEEREYLNEIYNYNPLLFDFVFKRTLKHPRTGARFPASIFMRDPVAGF